ncbi:MAG: hypothetical protein NZM28_00910 [Fimbriimonadales bacterium]|nr:hypothetical protein [Fimbriimonadales bacterium]
MSLIRLSEEQLRDFATPKVYARGEELCQGDAVRNITLRDERITAQVKGTYQPFYMVVLELENGEVVAAECDCEYEFEGWCKHIVATVLTCIRQPERVETLPSIQPAIDMLEREEMQQLLSELAREDPTLARRIEALTERRAARAQLSSNNSPQLRVSNFAPDLVSRSVDILGEQGELIQQLIEQQNIESAFQLIEQGMRPLAAELSRIPAYEYEADERDEQAWAYSILLTELILSAPQPPPALRERIVARTTSWRDSVSEPGVEYFELCAVALARYWNVDARLFEDEEEDWADEFADDFDFGEDDDLADWDEPEQDSLPSLILRGYERDLADITLHILEYRGQTRQYLELARANRFRDRLVIMLALQGDVENAAQQAYQSLETTAEWHGVIRAFYYLGAVDAAFEMAQHALEIPMLRRPFFGFVGDAPSRLTIAEWLLEHAQQHGRSDLALKAAQAAFEEEPTLTRYRQLAQLAGDQWDTMRPHLLRQLEQIRTPQRSVADIFIHEGLYAQALDALIRGYSLTPAYARQLARHLPDKVRELCQQEAEKIIQKNRSRDYLLAAEWLQVVKEIDHAQGRESEWQAFIHLLIEENKRKRALVPLLEQLR